MKKIFFHHSGTYHSLFSSILDYPPEGFKIIRKKQNQFSSKINNIKSYRFSLQLFHNYQVMYLLCNAHFYLSYVYEKDMSNIDLILSAHRIMHIKKIPWVVMIEYVGDLCPKIYDMKKIHLYKSYIEKNLKSNNCKRIIPYLNIEKQTLFKYLDCSKFKEKITVVHLSVKPKEFNKKYNKENLSILFMGTSNVSNIEYSFKERGGVEVLEAFNEISNKYSNIELIIRAKIPRDILVKFSKLLSKPNIKIIDRIIPLNKFRSLMENSDMLLFPGYITPAMTFIDAMSYEIPIIATDWRGNNEMIQDNVTGYLIRSPYRLKPVLPLSRQEKKIIFSKGPDSLVIQELIEKMSILIEEKKLRQKMGRSARKEIETGKFSIKKRNSQLKEIFNDALSRA